MKKYAAHDRANILLGNFVSMNEVELGKLKTNPQLRKKVIDRLMAKSSPSKPKGGGLGIGSG